MAANLTWFPLDPKAGAMFLFTQTVPNSQGSGATALSAITGVVGYELPAATFNLGERQQGNNNSLWVFVKASTTVTSGNIVQIDQNYNANNLTATMSIGKFLIGIAQFQNVGIGLGSIQSTVNQQTAQPGDFFWAAMQGNGLSVNVAASAAASNQLFVSNSTGGSVSSTATTVILHNLFVNASAGFVTSAAANQSTIDVEAIAPIVASV